MTWSIRRKEGRAGWQVLVACGDLDVPHTLLALHVAAPVELAPAPLRPSLPPGGVAAVTAQQVAAVDTLRLLKQQTQSQSLLKMSHVTHVCWKCHKICIGSLLISKVTHRVTLSAGCAETSLLHVILAVVGGGDQVDQVGVPVVLEPRELCHQHSSSILPLLLHFVSSVKLFFQHCSDLKIDLIKQWLQQISQHPRSLFNLLKAFRLAKHLIALRNI